VSDSFGAAALGLFGLAARLLGWRPADFWAATPAELIAALVRPGGEPTKLDRGTLEKMMEQDDG
jgi:Phage tail assembly chaperone protein, TAC